MKVLLLGTNGVTANDPEYYERYLDFFKTAAQQSRTELEVVYCMVDDLFIAVGDGQFSIRDMRNGHELSEFQAVLIRGHIHEHVDVVKTVSMYLQQHGIPGINDYSMFRTASKLIQAVHFQVYGLPVAQTVFVTPAVVAALDRLPFEFPCIMKATNGSHGNFNYKVAGAEDVTRVLEEDGDKHKFVLQRFMPNDCDYRVLIAGDEVMVIKRTAVEDSHLNNTSKGGDAVLVDAGSLPSEIIEQSRHIVKKIHMTIAGVDVLYDQSRDAYSFLEVNSQPQLMTGAFVPEKAEMIGRYFHVLAGNTGSAANQAA